MTKIHEILNFLEAKMLLKEFADSSLNGLQVEGKAEIKNIAVAVDAGLTVIEKAIKANADLLLVHHGIFWGKPFPITGSAKTLIELLLKNQLNLVGIHLPLDAHNSWGNNFGIAKMLKLSNLESCAKYQGNFIGCRGTNSAGQTLSKMREILSSLDGADPEMLMLPFGPTIPKNVVIVSGSACDTLYSYREEGFDTFITGEPKQFAYHFALENQLNVIFAGHYATETVGVKALGKALAEQFQLKCQFLDCPTGI